MLRLSLKGGEESWGSRVLKVGENLDATGRGERGGWSRVGAMGGEIQADSEEGSRVP